MEEFRPDIQEIVKYLHELAVIMGCELRMSYGRNTATSTSTGTIASIPTWSVGLFTQHGALIRETGPVLAIVANKITDLVLEAAGNVREEAYQKMLQQDRIIAATKAFPIPEEDAMRQIQAKDFVDLPEPHSSDTNSTTVSINGILAVGSDHTHDLQYADNNITVPDHNGLVDEVTSKVLAHLAGSKKPIQGEF